MSKKIVTMGYIDIIDKLINKETSCYVVERAYIANGMVYIKGGVKSGTEFTKTQLLPLKYAPYTQALANIHYTNTSADNGKVQTLFINADGYIDGWVRTLSNYEPFTFMYPLKVD